MVLLPENEWRKPEGAEGLLTVGCATDNQGNAFLVDRLMTTKYPFGVILIELCHQLPLRQAVLRAQWVPRDQNEEADALTNSDSATYPRRSVCTWISRPCLLVFCTAC